jgi:AraC-like DNA-binding protein
MDFSSIAILLGYSEASSFFRAYKKYYNKTPKEYKAKD